MGSRNHSQEPPVYVLGGRFVRYTCDNCGHRIQAASRMVGSPDKCARCHANHLVPIADLDVENSSTALAMNYQSEIEILEHQLRRDCKIEESRSDVDFRQFAAELRGRNLSSSARQGLNIKEAREQALVDLSELVLKATRLLKKMELPKQIESDALVDVNQLRKNSAAKIVDDELR